VFLATARLAIAEPPETGDILLIDQPKVYAEPSTRAATLATDWRAGRRMAVLQRAEDGATTDPLAGWFLVRPRERDAVTMSWVPGAFLAPPPAAIDAIAGGAQTVDRRHGLPPDYAPDDLVPVGPGYDDDIDYRLRREAAGALATMLAAARADGITLSIASAYRSWETQQRLYQKKLERDGWHQDAVARPGHSEHQLGTAVDLTDGDEATLLRESFGESRAGRWLRDHAWRYGFAQSYTRRNQPQTGYAPEPWHYRYWGVAQAKARQAAAPEARP
jgi:LAS superfamily LD-carboxypeptidase LdcB